MNLPRVLIISDDRETGELFKFLAGLDHLYDVSLASGCQTGLQKIQELAPDIVVIDYHLIDGLGTDFVRDLRADEHYHRLPVIMASGFEREEEALASGVDRYVIKPYQPYDMIAMLDGLLGLEGRELSPPQGDG